MKVALALPPLLAALFAPAAALACPACARDSSPLAGLLVAGMIGAPYLIGVVAVRAIRAGGEPGAPAEPEAGP